MKCVVVDHPFGVASIKLAEHPKSGTLGDARIRSGSPRARWTLAIYWLPMAPAGGRRRVAVSRDRT